MTSANHFIINLSSLSGEESNSVLIFICECIVFCEREKE